MSDQRQFISAADARGPFFVGVDLGATNVKVGVVDDLGQSLSWLSIRTEGDRGPEDATRRMAEAVDQAIQQAGVGSNDVVRVGLATPGTMDIPLGKFVKPVNLKGWEEFPIRDRLAQQCGRPVTFLNDGTAAAWGEFWIGAGQDMNSLVMLTLGTGLGCGIIIDGVSLDGENSHAGECGHIVINLAEDARWCNCGQRGHLEAYASATAIIRRTRDRIDAGLATSLRARLEEGAELTPKLIGEEAENGDALSDRVIMETARYLGIGLVGLIHTIDPNGVLLGGAMTFGGNQSELGRRFIARVKQEIDQLAFALLAERLVLEYAALGGDAGYIGAAGAARADHLKAESP